MESDMPDDKSKGQPSPNPPQPQKPAPAQKPASANTDRRTNEEKSRDNALNYNRG